MKLSVSEMAGVLVEFGDLIPLPNGFYEDMCGHIVDETDVESYFENFMSH
jgi:hypothetical protein